MDISNLPEWMKPTIEEVQKRREEYSCGMMTAREQVIHERVKSEMPGIIAERDFDKLADVVLYLLAKNEPPRY